MIVTDGSHITLSAKTVADNNASAAPAKGKQSAPSPVTVDSAQSDLNYGANLLTFTRDVKVRGRGMLLDSDSLNITLEEADGTSAAADKSGVQQRKKPVRALAVGNVHAEDDSGVLDSGELDIRFGESVTPGKREIEKVFVSGKVRLQNKTKQPPQPDDNFIGPTLLGSSKTGITNLDADRGEMDRVWFGSSDRKEERK